AAMDFDLQLGQVVLAQADGRANLILSRYDGATWTAIPLATTYTVGTPDAVVHRLASARLEVIAGQHVFELSHAPALADSYGNGCGADPPGLAARTQPRLSADFGLEVVRAPAGAPVAIFGG